MGSIATRKRILLIGGTKRAVKTLSSIVNRSDVDYSYAIFMRGYSDEVEYADQLASIAISHGLNYQTSDKLSTDIEIMVEEMNLDAIVGIGVWRSLLPERFINSARYGFLALHGTPLPKYRGFAGIYWQIINGEDSITLRALRLATGIDDGSIVCDGNGNPVESFVDLRNELNVAELLDQYDQQHISLTNILIDLVRDDNIVFKEQDHLQATYSCHRGPEDGEVNWNDTTTNIVNFIRAQSKPLPGAYTFFKGTKVFLWGVRARPEFSNYVGRICGKVVQRDPIGGSVVILTQDSGIEIIEADLAESISRITQRPYEIFDSVRSRCTNKAEAFLFNLEVKDSSDP